MESLQHSGVLGRMGALIVEVTPCSHRNSLEGNQVAEQRGATFGCAANWKLMLCEVGAIHCGTHLIASNMISLQLDCFFRPQTISSHVIRVWSATGSVRDEPCDQCRINCVISAWSVTWSVHDQARDLHLLIYFIVYGLLEMRLAKYFSKIL